MKQIERTNQGDATIDKQVEWSEFIYWRDLTDEQRKDFDYLETEEEQEQASFVEYDFITDGELVRTEVYSLDCFMRLEHRAPDIFEGFHGQHGTGYFDGLLIELSDCGSCYKLAHFCS